MRYGVTDVISNDDPASKGAWCGGEDRAESQGQMIDRLGMGNQLTCKDGLAGPEEWSRLFSCDIHSHGL